MRIGTGGLDALVAARQRMGAPLHAIASIARPDAIRWPETAAEVRFTQAEEVERAPDGGILIDGRRCIIHIQDTWDPLSMLENEPWRSKKYHLYHCRTIVQMLEAGRFERYVGTDRIDSQFTVHSREPDGTRETTEAHLAPCRNCLAMAGHTGPRESFRLDEWMAAHGDVPRDGPMPSTRDTDGRSSDYGPDWEATSARIRRERGWRCEQCNVHLEAHPRLLQVHHVDGVKSNDRTWNLRALCLLCHRDQPNHAHLRVAPTDARQIYALRGPSR